MVHHMVLDKSFLEGSEALAEVARSGHRFIVTAEHYVEVSTSSRSVTNLLKKLHGLSEHVDILDHVGILYRYEIQNQSPCSPLSGHFFSGVLNPNFSFQFTDEQAQEIKEERDHLEIESANMFELVAPEIWNNVSSFKREDICKRDVIQKIYNRLRPPTSNLPGAGLLDVRWALYRRLQVELLAAMDYHGGFDGVKFNIGQERRGHDQIDFRICIVGALAGGLAACDKKIRQYFKEICPGGVLYPS